MGENCFHRKTILVQPKIQRREMFSSQPILCEWQDRMILCVSSSDLCFIIVYHFVSRQALEFQSLFASVRLAAISSLLLFVLALPVVGTWLGHKFWPIGLWRLCWGLRFSGESRSLSDHTLHLDWWVEKQYGECGRCRRDWTRGEEGWVEGFCPRCLANP